jgi:hypothetical protein
LDQEGHRAVLEVENGLVRQGRHREPQGLGKGDVPEDFQARKTLSSSGLQFLLIQAVIGGPEVTGIIGGDIQGEAQNRDGQGERGKPHWGRP